MVNVAGTLNYTNVSWRVVRDDQQVSIVPVRARGVFAATLGTMAATDLVLSVFFLYEFAIMTAVCAIAAALVVSGIIVAAVTWLYASEEQKGPWLVVDLGKKTVALPRQREVVEITPDTWLELVEGFNPLPAAEMTWIAELHLVTRHGDAVRRYPVVGAVDVKHLKRVIDEIGPVFGGVVPHTGAASSE